MRFLFACFILACAAPGTAAAQASFDCARARSLVEQAICATRDLADLDGELNRAYGRTRDLLPQHERRVLLDQQRAWVRSRDTMCVAHARVDTLCLVESYRRRLAELAGAAPAAGRTHQAAFEWTGNWRFARPGFSGEMRISPVATGSWRMALQTSMSSGSFSTCEVTAELREAGGSLVGSDTNTSTAIRIDRQGAALLVTQISDGGQCGLNATFEGPYRRSGG